MRAPTSCVAGLAVAIALIAGCHVDDPHFVLPYDSSTADATVDGSAACEPDTIVCDDATAHYVECSSTGHVQFEMDCPLGCADGVEKCLDVDPSNGLAAYLDMAKDGPDIAFTGGSMIYAGGMAFNGGTSVDIPNALFNGMRIMMFHSLSVSGTLTTQKGGDDPALVLVVDGDVTIDGILDVSADNYDAGPGGYEAGVQKNVTDACNGETINVTGTLSGGAGGAGHAQIGGQGGLPGSGGTAAAGGQGFGFTGDTLEPLRGGCAGGTAGEGLNFSEGGGGGGAIQIVSRTSITLSGSGAIDASGGGATHGGGTVVGGGGGGSGGDVLLEAPQIILDGAVVISTKGGSGAAAGSSSTNAGADGGLAPGATPGGTNPTLPDGGAGGTRGIPPTPGESAGSSTQDGGGGGGAVGRTRFNTSTGLISPQGGAAIYSEYSTGVIHTREVPP